MTTVIEFYIPKNQRKQTRKELENYFDESVCRSIEEGLYDFTKQYCKTGGNNLNLAVSIYKDATKNLLFNCERNCPTIKSIKKLIKAKKYNPYNLAFSRPDELDKDNWIKIILRKTMTEEKLTNLPTVEWKRCRNDNNTSYSYYQLQTRSADEPITTFYICKECGKTYKVNN